MNGMDNCKYVKFRHKSFLSLLKKDVCRVAVPVSNVLQCILQLNHEQKPITHDFFLKCNIFFFVCNGMDNRNGT